jgi:hypothetical protein
MEDKQSARLSHRRPLCYQNKESRQIGKCKGEMDILKFAEFRTTKATNFR